jgi:hypothetical protein
MAEFSKQYCEIHDPYMTHDFDILQMAKQVQPEHYIPIICEGFGFIGIGKNEEGEIILAFRKFNDEIEWKPYKEVIK